MIKGIPFPFGEKTLIVPPLSLGALEAMEEQIAKLTANEKDPAQVTAALDIVTAALKRNYPEMTRAEVGDLVDVANMRDVIEAVMDASGVKRKAMEAAAAGEVGAPLNGAASLPG